MFLSSFSAWKLRCNCKIALETQDITDEHVTRASSLSLLLARYLHPVVFINVYLFDVSCYLLLLVIIFQCLSPVRCINGYRRIQLCSSMFVCLMFTAIFFSWSLLLAGYLYLVVSNHEEPAEDIQLLKMAPAVTTPCRL